MNDRPVTRAHDRAVLRELLLAMRANASVAATTDRTEALESLMAAAGLDVSPAVKSPGQALYEAMFPLTKHDWLKVTQEKRDSFERYAKIAADASRF